MDKKFSEKVKNPFTVKKFVKLLHKNVDKDWKFDFLDFDDQVYKRVLAIRYITTQHCKTHLIEYLD